MTEGNGDRELRERFQHLRREERATAPGFQSALAGARRMTESEARRPAWSTLAAGVSVAVALGLMIFVTRDHDSGNGRAPLIPEASVGGWYTPTDALLETPGIELLRTVPQLRLLDPGPGLRIDPEPRSQTLERLHA